MNAGERISHDPSICGGKPTIRGTRVSVETIIEFLRAGDEPEEILAEYPSLDRADIEAAIEFAAARDGAS